MSGGGNIICVCSATGLVPGSALFLSSAPRLNFESKCYKSESVLLPACFSFLLFELQVKTRTGVLVFDPRKISESKSTFLCVSNRAGNRDIRSVHRLRPLPIRTCPLHCSSSTWSICHIFVYHTFYNDVRYRHCAIALA